jgi:hypothetical protein
MSTNVFPFNSPTVVPALIPPTAVGAVKVSANVVL